MAVTWKRIAFADNTAYDAGTWDGNLDVPTKNAVRDKFESLTGGGMSWEVININTNAVTDTGYLINASGGNITLTLPAAPSEGDTIGVCDFYNKATTNTITLGRNSLNIEGIGDDLIIDIDGAGFTISYTDVTRGWEIVSEISSGAQMQAATNVLDGYATAAHIIAIEANTAKDTNVSTDLSEGTSTETTVDVNSSDGSNATLVAASASRAGLLTKAKFDEIVVNSGKTGVTTEISSVVEDSSPELGGEMDCGAHSIGFTQQSTTGDGTTTIDWKLGNKFQFTWGAQANTFTFTAPSNPCNLLMKMIQDGTGGRDATWPANVKWLGDEPTWTDGGVSKVMLVSMYYDGTDYWAQGTPWEV